MTTAAPFSDIIFGPVKSRRLGLSLGVNLLPLDNKLCSFDCIYCECGWAQPGVKPRFNSRADVREQLERKLREMIASGELPDAITFAGNGEPTLHPDFEAVIDDTLALRHGLCPEAQVSVLTNGTQIDRESVRRALMRVDNNIVKLDSAFDETAGLIDHPRGDYSVARQVELMKRFDGKLILQTMLLQGEHNGRIVDNTTDREIDAWLELLPEIRPRRVMIYTIDRPTPVETLHKVPPERLKAIAERVERLGIPCTIAT